MKNHPNKIAFRGVLAILNRPSDKSPMGARGHRILLSSTAAKAAVHTLKGMGVCVREDWRGHEASRKIGVIDNARVRGDKLLVSGYLFRLDVPGEIAELKASADFGMSFEVKDSVVTNMRAEVWNLDRVTFTGAAILKKDAAAWSKTEFVLADQ